MPYDPRRDELVTKVSALVLRDHGGDYRAAFDKYAVGGLMGRDELYKLLYDAGVGNRLTRGAWVSGLLEAVDRDPRDGVVTWDEFLKAVG